MSTLGSLTIPNETIQVTNHVLTTKSGTSITVSSRYDDNVNANRVYTSSLPQRLTTSATTERSILTVFQSPLPTTTNVNLKVGSTQTYEMSPP